jgi:hypothetical protein
MANLLQSTQTTATAAPQFYTDYLSNLATKGQAAQQGAQYVGAQPLQEQAFSQIGQTAGAYQPAITTGENLVGQAAGQNIAGVAAPYLQAGTSSSPLSALNPYAQKVSSASPADLAAQYMNPYINTAVQSLSDIAQRNYQQNLAPQATAAAVGSGQFGSQRGAQVLGQVERQSQQDLNSQIAQMLSSGYGQGLTAAGQYQSTLGQLGSTASNAQNSFNTSQLQAGQTAADAASKQAQALQSAGLGMGTLGTQGQTMNLADVNALSTLGGQQQQIGQNAQNYPLTTLSSLSNIMQGAQVPTTVTSQLNASPLSTLAGLGTGALGMIQPKYDAAGKVIAGSTPFDQIKALFSGSSNTGTNVTTPDTTQYTTSTSISGQDVTQAPDGSWLYTDSGLPVSSGDEPINYDNS